MRFIEGCERWDMGRQFEKDGLSRCYMGIKDMILQPRW